MVLVNFNLKSLTSTDRFQVLGSGFWVLGLGFSVLGSAFKERLHSFNSERATVNL